MITGVSLNHGGQYHFRLHKKKLSKLCNEELKLLEDFLYLVIKERPEHYFKDGPRSSVLKFNIGLEPINEQHKIQFLARMGLDSNYYGDNHLNVQMFMLAYDNSTIAIEVPIWLEPTELEFYEKIFQTSKPLSGHIDAVSIQEGKIWIWDYKPNAHREKYATTQTYFYALMLSKRTNIPLEKFMCGYFDDKNTYTFDPSEVSLEETF